jgi:hypothetical protein
MFIIEEDDYILNEEEFNLAKMEIDIIKAAFRRFYKDGGMPKVLKALNITEVQYNAKVSHYKMDIISLKRECLGDDFNMNEVERKMIIDAIKKYYYCRAEDIAIALGISDRTLQRKVKDYNLDIKELRFEGRQQSKMQQLACI